MATDKGYTMALDMDTVLGQIHSLPEQEHGRKIPFELINENPLPGLPGILDASREQGIHFSQVNLTMRADWFIAGEKHLRTALTIAQEQHGRILLSSMGFESFDDSILAHLNKGLTVATNMQAIELMRRLKHEFPEVWGYSRSRRGDPWLYSSHAMGYCGNRRSTEPKNHSAPTTFPVDILPAHSIPLIIHHASSLGDWIREIEQREGITFKRYISTIGWWDVVSSQ